MARDGTVLQIAGQDVKLITPGRVLYPASETTKAQVVAFYVEVAPAMLPHLMGRPATRKRWPEGVDGPAFFAKDLEPGRPAWLGRVQVQDSGPKFYPVVETPAALAWLGQVSALELHVPQWRFGAPTGPRDASTASPEIGWPDRVAFDLDPGPGAGLTECVEVALMLRDRLGPLGARSVPVSSGSKGLHVYVPMDDPITEFSNLYPWQWTAAEVEAFIDSLRSEPHRLAVSTARNYTVELRLFLEYLTDPRYGWGQVCKEKFGSAPEQVLDEWNTVVHVTDFEGSPGRRPLSYDEVQRLFDATDDLVDRAKAKHRKGVLVAYRNAAILKTIYAFGLRRQEAWGLDVTDLRRNPKIPAYGSAGAVMVRWGKSSRGSAPKRRTVLLVPEMDWWVPVIEQWLTELRPRLGPAAHPALWITERRGRLDWRGINAAFVEARDLAGLDRALDLHSLRHSYVTHLVEFDYPERFVQEQAGHAYASTTSIYTSVSDAYRKHVAAQGVGGAEPGTMGAIMIKKMGSEWHLRLRMAERGLFATSDLVPQLAERGIHLSREQVYRLVTSPPQRLSMDVLAALCDILDCTPNDLITVSIVDEKVAKSVAGQGRSGGLGSSVPVNRTRIRRPGNPEPAPRS